MRIVSYNTRGLRLGQSAADKARRLVVDKLLEDSDILCLQETFLPKQELDKLNSVNSNFQGAGESTTDLSLGLVHGRISGGVAIMWHKKYDPIVTVIRLGVDWCIAIKVAQENNVFIILNIYTPYECYSNEDVYLQRLAFIGSFIEECEYTCIYVMGDFNADVSDVKSLFGQYLTQFCQDNKLTLSSKVLLPTDSYTYVSEAWNTTSWLDHCICTTEAHESIDNVEIMYGMATADHMPVSLMLNIETLPELTTKDNHSNNVKVDWDRLTENDLGWYYSLSENILGDIEIPYDAILCDNVNCDNPKHRNDLCAMYNDIVLGLNNASKPLCNRRAKQQNVRPGWNEHVSALHQRAREAFKNWAALGKPRHGPVCDLKKQAVTQFKYAVRFIKRSEHTLRANSLAKKLLHNDVRDFWKEVKVMNASKIPLPSSIDGVTGTVNIAELWRKHYSDLLNCVKSEDFSIDTIPYENVVIRAEEVSSAIGKLALNKSCGPDQITAEHLRFASHRVFVLLALSFSGMLVHGILSSSMLSVLLVPVIKDKTGKISSIENYRPIALTSVLSKVLERILLDRLEKYVVTTDYQFGFKSKHGTDMCIYALKEAVSKYTKQNSTMFLCFLDASKAFDRINHGKLFVKLQERGVPPYLIRVLHFWYANQTMRVRWGNTTSDPFLVTNGVRQGGILSPMLFNLYMDDLSKRLKDCKTGCMVGDRLINHLLYADDLVIMSPYSAGLQQLLRVCSDYGQQFDIKFNSKKSVIMMVKTKEDRTKTFPTFVLSDNVLTVVNKVKYLGHIIRDDLCDDDDIQRQYCKLYAQSNMVARKFYMCSDHVKIALFKAYCTPLYTAHLWCRYSKAKMHKLQVAYNDALRILLKVPRWTSASQLFVLHNVPTLNAVIRNVVHKFLMRMEHSVNEIINVFTMPKKSSIRYTSCYWRHWRLCLYGL